MGGGDWLLPSDQFMHVGTHNENLFQQVHNQVNTGHCGEREQPACL